MKTKIICSLLFSIVSFCPYLFSQVAIHDALTLKYTRIGNEIFINKDENNLAILAQYLSDTTPNGTAIQLQFGDNPFFKIGGGAMASESFSKVKGILSSIGGLNVTNFADGLAKFMVKRFKEELNLAFFEKFKQDLDDPRYIELRILFPESHQLLKAIGTEIYRYNVYIITLREAFIKDLSNLYAHLDKLFRLPKYKDFLDARPVLKTILRTSLYLINQLSRGNHAGDILAEFPVNELDFNNPALTKNIGGTIETMKLFSASLRSKSPDRYWVSPDSLKLLFKDTDFASFRIYLGLVYQQSKKIVVFKDNHRLTEILDQLAIHLDSLGQYRGFIESFVDKAEEVNEYIIELKDKKKSEIDYNDYYNLFSASIDIIEHSFLFVELPYVGQIINVEEVQEIADKAGHWIFTARTAGEIYIDARTKNYSSAILNTTVILDTIVKTVASIAKGKLLKYGTFMAAIAAAENSDDVAKVIEAMALPVGGSSIKKHSSFNIAIQSYLGGFYGSENIEELKIGQRKNSAGIFAPVGISVSLPLFTNLAHPASVSIVANILDIGAIASFRFKDDSTAINSNIELRNIFAPGAYLVIGLPKVPISIGYGFQTGPQLREIKEGVPTLATKKIYTRSSFFIAVDIPLFNLYNKAN
ncbi:MAG: hypothetical protein ABIP10_00330 [Ferruginibacter sp.]